MMDLQAPLCEIVSVSSVVSCCYAICRTVEGLQGQQLRSYALTQALRLTTKLAAAVAAAAAASRESVAASPFLAPLRLLLSWLSSDDKLVM